MLYFACFPDWSHNYYYELRLFLLRHHCVCLIKSFKSRFYFTVRQRSLRCEIKEKFLVDKSRLLKLNAPEKEYQVIFRQCKIHGLLAHVFAD